MADSADSRTATARPTDVQLSDDARSLSRLVEGDTAATFDQDRVESIRQAICEGRYHVDLDRLTDKLTDL